MIQQYYSRKIYLTFCFIPNFIEVMILSSNAVGGDFKTRNAYSVEITEIYLH